MATDNLPQPGISPSGEQSKEFPDVESCGYQGYEFGASYPDSICVDGQLYDADNCDDEGNLYEPLEDVPCPMCREEDAIEWWFGRGNTNARLLVADIRGNRLASTSEAHS